MIQDIRTDYSKQRLNRHTVDSNPIMQFRNWFGEALKSEVKEVNAFNLATASSQGRPSGRIVLLKGVQDEGFVFFTNYNSSKGSDLEVNPFAAITFFWPELERQVRIQGSVKKVSKQESEDYFHSRPRKSQLGAWASKQSTSLPNRFALIRKFLGFTAKFVGKEVDLPDFWGGYLLIPDQMEFWQGRPSRLHDRINYRLADGNWIIERLSP